MKVLVPPGAAVQATAPLPPGTELIDYSGTVPAAARVLVLHHDDAGELPRLLAAAPQIEIVQALTAGVDWLLDAVPPGVTVCSGSGIHDIPVTEWCVAAILAMRRRFPDHLQAQARGEWQPGAADGDRDLEGARVLIVGHGSIGRTLEGVLACFGARIDRIARTQRPGVHPLSAWPELVPQADVVVILLPSTPETDGVVDAAFLEAMRPGALLVNAGRGSIVDTAALVERLQAGHINAALDVTDPEPLPAGHPLWRAPNTLITPHIAGSVEGWQRRGWRFVGDQLRRIAAGEPPANARRA